MQFCDRTLLIFEWVQRPTTHTKLKECWERIARARAVVNPSRLEYSDAMTREHWHKPSPQALEIAPANQPRQAPA
jgi:hypothetical protein